MKIYFSYNEDPTPEGFTKANPDDMQSIEAGTVEECHGTNILEKVSDLPLFLDNVYAILTPGGKAVFQSGYYGCATSYMSPLVKRSLLACVAVAGLLLVAPSPAPASVASKRGPSCSYRPTRKVAALGA